MTFSASRIGTWIACNRKAAWEYFCGYRSPETASTQLGTAVHAVLETWMKTGEPIDRTTKEGEIASEALPYVQHLTGRGAAEEQFFTVGRHKWQGYKDLRGPGFVLDYKTTSDFKWAKTPEILQNDPQAILYAEDEFRRAEATGNSLETVQLTWLYLKTRGTYSAKPVETQVTRAQAKLGFRVLESFADEMQAAAFAAPLDVVERHRHVLTLAPNLDHCNDYGGCPHKARCGIEFFSDRGETKMSNGNMSFIDRMRALSEAENKANGVTASPTITSPPEPPPASAYGSSITYSPSWGATEGNPHPMSARTDIPELPTSPALPPAPPAPVAAPTVPATAPAVNPPRRGPGRPRKTLVEASTPLAAEMAKASDFVLYPAPIAPAPVAAPVAPVAPAPVAPAPVAPVDKQSPYIIDILFVGCMPRPVATSNFDDLIMKAKTMIGPKDYRLHDFGKGNGLLLDAVTAVVQAEKPEYLVVADPRGPEATLCLSYLRSVAVSVVEALR